MRLGPGLKRLFSRPRPAPDLDPVGYRLPSYLVGPDPASPPPAPAPAPQAAIPQPVGGPPQVKLLMADGSVERLPADPELERRAAYLVRSMIPPAPPPPPAASDLPD